MGGGEVEWLRWYDQKNNIGFELCPPCLTISPSFIKVGPKLVYWGGLGGWGSTVVGAGLDDRVVGVADQKNNSGFEVCTPFLTSAPTLIQIGPKFAKLVI